MPIDVWGTYVSPDEFEEALKRGICRTTVNTRIANGWKVRDAIVVPPIKKNEEYKQFKKVAISNGIKEDTFKRRVQRGWALEDAANSPLVSKKESNIRANKARKRVIPEAAVKEAAKNGICYSTLYSRLRCGMKMAEAISVSKERKHPWRYDLIASQVFKVHLKQVLRTIN